MSVILLCRLVFSVISFTSLSMMGGVHIVKHIKIYKNIYKLTKKEWSSSLLYVCVWKGGDWYTIGYRIQTPNLVQST